MKWGCIQPLSGGAYFGAELAFGNQAEWIISFPGLDENNPSSCPNEYPVLKYLTDKQKCPPYWQFNGKMFNMDLNNLFPEFVNSVYTPEEYLSQDAKDDKLKEKLDMIIAVPVCSGLSAANMSEQKTDIAVNSSKNDNFKFITKFVLERLKPRVYVFENAPALATKKGEDVRVLLNGIARNNGYSVTYLRTNTNLHDNVQSRERTFAIFWEGNEVPKIDFKHNSPQSVVKYLAEKIPVGATQNDPVKDCVAAPLEESWDYRFIKHKYGDTWRSVVTERSLLIHILDNNLDQECINFLNDDKLSHSVVHARNKINKGMGFFDRSKKVVPDTHVPTLFFKTVPNIMHPTEDRLYTIREIMTLMGLPSDYEWPWSNKKFPDKIGQNVPVLTARDVCAEIRRVLELKDKGEKVPVYPNPVSNVFIHDNIKFERSYYEKMGKSRKFYTTGKKRECKCRIIMTIG